MCPHKHASLYLPSFLADLQLCRVQQPLLRPLAPPLPLPTGSGVPSAARQQPTTGANSTTSTSAGAVTAGQSSACRPTPAPAPARRPTPAPEPARARCYQRGLLAQHWPRLHMSSQITCKGEKAGCGRWREGGLTQCGVHTEQPRKDTTAAQSPHSSTHPQTLNHEA